MAYIDGVNMNNFSLRVSKDPSSTCRPWVAFGGTIEVKFDEGGGGHTPSFWTLWSLIHHLRLDSWFDDQIPGCMNSLLLWIELEVSGFPRLDVDCFLDVILELCPDLLCRFTGSIEDPVVSFFLGVP